jgi:hypothetical protein
VIEQNRGWESQLETQIFLTAFVSNYFSCVAALNRMKSLSCLECFEAFRSVGNGGNSFVLVQLLSSSEVCHLELETNESRSLFFASFLACFSGIF